MNRYYVFKYDSYYPNGGMNDCLLRTNDREEAVKKATTERDENFSHVSVWDVVEEKYIELPEEE